MSTEHPLLNPQPVAKHATITEAVTHYLKTYKGASTKEVQVYVTQSGLDAAPSTINTLCCQVRQSLNLNRDEPTISDLKYVKEFAKKLGGMKKLEKMVADMND